MLLLILFGPAVPAAPPPAAAQTEDMSIEFVGSIGGMVNAVAVDGSYAYMGEGAALTVLDVSNPANLNGVAYLPLPDMVRDIDVENDIAYVSVKNRGLYTVDVSNLDAPTLLGSYDACAPFEVQATSSLVYATCGTDGLHIIDVSDPAAPALLGTYQQTNSSRGAYNLHIVGSYAYLIERSTPVFGRLAIIDVSISTAPTLVSTYETASTARDVYVNNNKAYITDTDDIGVISIIDVSDPTTPTPSGSFSPGAWPLVASLIQIVGGEIYLSIPGAGFQVESGGTYSEIGDIDDMQIVESTAYLVDENGLHVVDVSDPNIPSLLDTYTPGAAEDVQVVGSYAYVAADADGLQIIDVSDPMAPRLLGSYDTGDSAESIQVENSTAYLATNGDGLQIINVNDPTTPILTSSYDTSGSAYDVYIADSYAYVADGSDGLQIIDVRDLGL
jgi:hypothetical protein